TAMLGKLAPCGGGPPILLPRPRLVVGRHRDCDVPLPFSTVSSRHCELELVDGYWHVRDLGSTNGTSINGTACTTGRLLPGDRPSVARHRYALLSPPPPDRPAPHRAPGPRDPVPPPAPEAPALGKLTPCGGGPPILLTGPRLVLGRDPCCDV